MKFYGFYISKKKENLRKQIIESGVLPFEELIKGKAEKTYSEMLDDLKNQPVFLFSGSANEKMKDSPFTEYLSEDEYNLESNVSTYKSYAKGVIQSVDPTTKNILIKWDEDYQPVTWYRYAISDPIWGLDTNRDAKHEQLYKIVFENQEMDYQWWAENGNWSDKRKGNFHYFFNEEPRVFKNVYELPKAAIEWLIEHNNLNYEQIKRLIKSTDSDTGSLVKLKSDFSNLSEEHKSKYISNSILDLEGNEFHVSNQWGRAGASKNKWDNFIQNCAKGGLEIKENRDAVAIMQTSNIENSSQLKTASLNQILYGPPGTGKTYNTVSEALSILGESELEEWQGKSVQNIEDLKQAFPSQVEFVTFHQSFSYEDFIEGLRANSDDGNLSYEIEDGVFKKVCIEAMFSKLKRDSGFKEVSFSELYDQFLMSVKAKLVEGPYSLATKSEKSLYIRTVSDKETLHVFHEGSEVLHSVGRKRLKRLFDVYPDIKHFDKIKNIHNEITEAIGGANSTVYWSVLNKVLLLKQEMIEQQDDGEDLSVLNYAQKKQELADTENPEFIDGNPHVLIIDEINRGNISRIFGELITLIEDSKRQGSAEAISVQLPYSKESFSVPNNLYIIGTMNTADRSLAMMDTALRRRFDFIEMMPNADLLNDYGNAGYVDDVDLVKLIAIINKRIEALYDREHSIGHAFFMSLNESSKIDDLANIFKNKILPLLEEYFYDDWQKIRLVLADQTKPTASGLQFYQEVEELEGFKQDGLFPQSNDSAIPTVNKSYLRQVSLNPEAYIRIYDTSYSNSLDEEDFGE